MGAYSLEIPAGGVMVPFWTEDPDGRRIDYEINAQLMGGTFVVASNGEAEWNLTMTLYSTGGSDVQWLRCLGHVDFDRREVVPDPFPLEDDFRIGDAADFRFRSQVRLLFCGNVIDAAPGEPDGLPMDLSISTVHGTKTALLRGQQKSVLTTWRPRVDLR